MPTSKETLRVEIRARLAALDADERQRSSLAACERLAGEPGLSGTSTVLLYMPLGREIDVLPLARRLLAEGRIVAVPRVEADGLALGAVAVSELPGLPRSGTGFGSGDGWIVDSLGVRVPAGGRPLSLAAIDAVLVPGVAFDSAGNRLGRGGGFYDRLLAALPPAAVTIGVCHEAQLVDAVPVESHDVRVSVVVTDRRTLVAAHYTGPNQRPMRPPGPTMDGRGDGHATG